jgi:hypothetical protein
MWSKVLLIYVLNLLKKKKVAIIPWSGRLLLVELLKTLSREWDENIDIKTIQEVKSIPISTILKIFKLHFSHLNITFLLAVYEFGRII